MMKKMLIAAICLAVLASCTAPFNGDLFQFVGVPFPTYTVNYNGNGNNAGSAPVDNAGVVAGRLATAIGPGSLSLTNAYYAGWNTQPDGSGTTYIAGETFTMVKGGLTLYAIWLGGSGGVLSIIPPNLTRLVVPSSIVTISAIGACPNLTSIDLPSSVTSIVTNAFMNCPNLAAINMPVPSSNFKVINGGLENLTTTTLVCVPAKLNGVLAIPMGITAVDQFAFNGCTNLTGITIPPT